MLSIDVKLIESNKMKSLAHIQITNQEDHPNRPVFGNYRWRIQDADGSISQGALNDYERARGPLELIFTVLGLHLAGLCAGH